MAPENTLVMIGDLMGMRLQDLCSEAGTLESEHRKSSVLVERWWDHMNEWRLEHLPDGITGIVLHRPKMNYDHATLFLKEWSVLYDRLGNL
jgi:hypothetical protein